MAAEEARGAAGIHVLTFCRNEMSKRLGDVGDIARPDPLLGAPSPDEERSRVLRLEMSNQGLLRKRTAFTVDLGDVPLRHALTPAQSI